MYSTSEIRRKFIDYFVAKNHKEVSSSSLIPANDPTLLFVNAGMVQFKDVFLGAETRKYSTAVTSQKCVRAGGKHNDLDQVGYTARHHTFFEMLGNFSFGDYFKQDAIKYAWNFLTIELAIPKEKLLVTVFEEDNEAEKIWINEIGVAPEKVLRIGAKDNFWQMGDTGPCGPCTEIFYDHGADIAGGPPGTPEEDGDRFIEIWNLVFMQYDKQANGDLLPLPKPCVDTGMGLERISSILQGQHNNYNIDLFQSIIKFVAELLGESNLNNPSLKVIADHIRTCAFLISDGILPSNEGRGYVLRRIIRRAIRHGYKIGATDTFFYKIVSPLVKAMKDAYPELLKSKDLIENALRKEELRFAETLETGMGILNKAIDSLKGNSISGDIAFKLYDTYGFPLDLTQDVAREHELTVDVNGFNNCMDEQKQRSKASGGFAQVNQLPADVISKINPTVFLGYEKLSTNAQIVALIKDNVSVGSFEIGDSGTIICDQTPFYAESGGQIGDTGLISTKDKQTRIVDTQKGAGHYHLHLVNKVSEQWIVGENINLSVDSNRRKSIVINHTATHLLHKVLQEQLGDHVQQKGSIVSNEKLRFDFSHSDAISVEKLQEIESIVNQHIRASYSAQTELMSYEDALNSGAMALFGEKYGDEVRVLNVGGYSIELCGGTHVKATGEIGLFKITSEASIAAGIRRIEAVTGLFAINYLQSTENTLNKVVQLTHSSNETVGTKVQSLLEKNKNLEKKLQLAESKIAGNAAEDLWSHVVDHNDVKYLFENVGSMNIENIRTIIDTFKDKYEKGIVVLANHGAEDKIQIICLVSKSLIGTIKAGDIIKDVTSSISGKGGGRPDFAQGGGVASSENLNKVLANKLHECKNLLNI
jgi:alanyl-tRNA synthetase